MDILAVLALPAAVVSPALFRLTYRRLKTGFFFYLLAASLSLACGCSALSLGVSGPADALADMSVALCGCFLTAAAASLNASFRLAGEHDD